MKTKLSFEEAHKYGNQLFYPTNELAKGVCLIAKRKTLSEEELKKLEAAGFEVETHYEYKFKPLTLNNEGK